MINHLSIEWLDASTEDMIELEESSILLWSDPLESERVCYRLQKRLASLAPCVEVSCPYHRSNMSLDHAYGVLELLAEGFPEVEVHRVSIDDEELFSTSSDREV